MSLRSLNFFQAQSESDADLPDELVDTILSELTLEELMNSKLVCKRLSAIANTDATWQRLFKKYFYMDITGPHCKEIFILFLTCLKAFKELPKALFIFDPAPGRKLALQNFIAGKSKKSDEIWLTFLQAISDLYFVELERKFIGNISQEEYEERVACSLSLLQRSSELNNPFALQRLAEIEVAASRFERAEILLTRAHMLGSLDATVALIEFYYDHYSKMKNPEQSIRLHHDLTLQAAKRGSSKAALHLGDVMWVFSVPSPIYIPFGDPEWKTFNLLQEMQTLNLNGKFTLEIFKDNYIPQLETLAIQGSALAAYHLSNFYHSSREISYAPKYNLFTNLHDKLYASALPARLERVCYWIEEAAKDPKMKDEAERLLRRVNVARNLSAGQTKQPLPKIAMTRR